MFLSQLVNEMINMLYNPGNLAVQRVESEPEGHSWSDSFGSRDDSLVGAKDLVWGEKRSQYFDRSSPTNGNSSFQISISNSFNPSFSRFGDDCCVKCCGQKINFRIRNNWVRILLWKMCRRFIMGPEGNTLFYLRAKCYKWFIVKLKLYEDGKQYNSKKRHGKQ